MRLLLLFWVSTFSLAFLGKIGAQDVQGFGKKENYNVHGGLNLGTNFYQAVAGPSRYAPFGFTANGNLQVQLGAIHIPIQLSYNNLQGSLSRPFQQYGASPYYKWVKLHLGYRSLNFSPYVYAGRTFRGVGIELTPGKFSMIAFKGTLRNLFSVQDTIVNGAVVLPSFDRSILGAKVGFGKQNKFELSAVKVTDEDSALPNSNLKPQDNLVLGAALKFKVFKVLQLQANAASSLFTSDTRIENPESLSEQLSQFNGVHQINVSSRLSFASDAALTYSKKKFTIGAKYKRINPYYYSLATNFMQNDIENYTLNSSVGLLKQKLRLRASAGVQRDNLRRQKAYTSNRIIGSATATYMPSKKLNLLFRYANYQHENTSGLAIINDTVKILTTMNTFQFNTNYKYFSNSAVNASLNLNIFNNTQVDESAISDRGFNGTGINTSLPFDLVRIGMTISPTFYYNQYRFSDFSQGRIGTGVTLSKKFLKQKISTGLTALFSQNQYNSKGNGNLFNASLSVNYKISKTNSISLRLYYFDNQTILSNDVKEFRGNVSVAFRL